MLSFRVVILALKKDETWGLDCKLRNSNCEIGVARLEIGDWRLRDWRLRDWSSLFPELLTGLWKLLCEVYI